MRVLCLCSYGNVRSSCLARQLKDHYGQEALVAGLVANSPATLKMLFEWAEVILNACELKPASYIGEDFMREKVQDFNPGPDVWGSPTHPELTRLMVNKIDDSKLFRR